MNNNELSKKDKKQIEKYDDEIYKGYTYKSEIHKALNSLVGIIRGVSIDNDVNPDEINELLNWCSLHRNLIKKPPYNTIIPMLDDALSDGVFSAEEIQDVMYVYDKYNSDLYYDMLTSDIQNLEGILHGIMSDNEITDDEIRNLQAWLDENESLKTTYPYEELNSLLLSILADGKVDDAERIKLKSFFCEFIDLKKSYNINEPEIRQLKEQSRISAICSVCPDITIKNHTFCFTGESSKHKRSDIANIIIELGGSFSNSVTKNTDYLIVGNKGNDCWAFECYGRKIEKAVDLRKSGRTILIIHENDFWDAVNDIM